MEPTPIRDNGPYLSHRQAREQFAAIIHGIPIATDGDLSGLSALVLAEALQAAGVETSDYENGQRDAIARLVDPEAAQVIAGWIIRARLGCDGSGRAR